MISATHLRDRISRGELNPADAVRHSLARVNELDPAVRAFVTIDGETALRAAASGTGPLRGVAIGVKDIFDTADMPTEMGSSIFAGWRPKADAGLVMMARLAGASIVGKTATSAFAHDDLPTTRNPVDLRYLPGGSSSGSAAAVGAGMVPLSFGTQTGGSIIRPASFCGTAAIKPSFGLLPTSGQKLLCPSLDTPGLFAASAVDLAFALSALLGRPMDKQRLGHPLKVGVTRQSFAGSVEPESEDALEAAITGLLRTGAKVTEQRIPSEFVTAWRQFPILADYEALQSLAWEWNTHRELVPPNLAAALTGAENLNISEFQESLLAASRARRVAGEFFNDLDAIITFSAPGIAPKENDSTGNARFNRLWTLLGGPCVNVPGYTNSEGMPVGVQVIAPFGADWMALAVAEELERALGGGQNAFPGSR